jgi:hypothetical protein
MLNISLPHHDDDLFASLGPLPAFSGDNVWSAPRTLLLLRVKGTFGIFVRGAQPVLVTGVEPKGPADVRRGREGGRGGEGRAGGRADLPTSLCRTLSKSRISPSLFFPDLHQLGLICSAQIITTTIPQLNCFLDSTLKNAGQS